MVIDISSLYIEGIFYWEEIMATSKKQKKHKKQIAANRRNAKKSTGPRTARGKAVSSRNAVKHGLYCRDLIIDSPKLKEDPAEYNNLLKSLFDDLRPKGKIQKALVHIIAECLWRQERALNAEIMIINRQLEQLNRHASDNELLKKYMIDPEFPLEPSQLASREFRDLMDYIGWELIPHQSAYDGCMGMEVTLDNKMHRALRLFLYLKNKPKSKAPGKICKSALKILGVSNPFHRN